MIQIQYVMVMAMTTLLDADEDDEIIAETMMKVKDDDKNSVPYLLFFSIIFRRCTCCGPRPHSSRVRTIAFQ
jgi:hypothetical protein